VSVRALLSLSFASLALAGAAADAAAQGQGGRGASRQAPAAEDAEGLKDLDAETVGAFFPMRARIEAMKARGFSATGLVPVYPDRVKCPEVDSPFAARTRGDGSMRAARFFQGFHGGIDIPVPEGTPVLAVAAGTVVFKTPGHSIGGIGIVLQHAPADTGLNVWTYTEYKHLKELPALDLGRRVAMGEAIALSGKTGTQDGHYGPAGHAHLHLGAFFSDRPDYATRLILVPADGRWMDPLALFSGPPAGSGAPAAPADAGGQVRIPYVTDDGAAVPAGTKTVWPLPCRAK